MTKNKWNYLAPNYQGEVMEIAKHDLNGTLRSHVEYFSSRKLTAADLGCGPGSLLPLMADKFKQVYAVDGAEELLNIARDKYDYPNVEFLHNDLSTKTRLPVIADVTFCMNVLINPSYTDRVAILRKVAAATKTDGTSIIVVPSMESEMHMYQALVRYKEKGKTKRETAVSEINKLFKSEVASPVEGIVDIGGALTKCYLREELERFVSQAGFNVVEIKKVEYSWDEIIDNPPRWLKEPYPWDWLVVARKN